MGGWRKGRSRTDNGDRVSGPGRSGAQGAWAVLVFGTRLSRAVKVGRGQSGGIRVRTRISLCNSCPYQAATGTVVTIRFDSIIFYIFSLRSPLLLFVQRNTLFSLGIFNTTDHSLVGTLLVFKSLFS